MSFLMVLNHLFLKGDLRDPSYAHISDLFMNLQHLLSSPSLLEHFVLLFSSKSFAYLYDNLPYCLDLFYCGTSIPGTP